MARMIPELEPASIENRGEKLFFEAVSRLPHSYTVIYGYRYIQHGSKETVREADFIIIHPTHGFLVVEVKQGEAAYHAGQWHEVKQGGYLPLYKDPVEQARSAMYHILHLYKREHRNVDYPLKSRYVICFPECTRIGGTPPADLQQDSLWVESDLHQITERVEALLMISKPSSVTASNQDLIKILTPSMRLSVALTDRIEVFARTADHILTEEQERIIEETMEDKRKLFLGSAGTGKTYIAIEKARRSVQDGKNVLLTCYNKNLVELIINQANDDRIKISNFHSYLEHVLKEKGILQGSDSADLDRYFKVDLAEQGFSYYSEASEEEMFDCILIDEGQDFFEEWLICLESMLRKDGELYIFADPNQNIFGTPESWQTLKRYTQSTQRLTQNFRNTEEINKWTEPFVHGKPAKSRISGGVPVIMHAWKDPDELKRLIGKEIGHLVSQGVAPNRITILSPYKRANSCLHGVSKIRDWPLVDFNSGEAGIQYATIRSFKGLETDIVLLIDIKESSKACTPADVYVGASRARYLLHVFHQEGWQLPQLRTAIR